MLKLKLPLLSDDELGGVSVDVPAGRAGAVLSPYERGGACGRLLLCHPLAQWLGWGLALALVPLVAALNLLACRAAPDAEFEDVCAHALHALFAQWQSILDGPEFPWLRPLLFALPVWRSPTAKLRAFAGAGDAGAARRLLGEARGSSKAVAAAARSLAVELRAGQQLLRGVEGAIDARRGDDACLAVVARLLAAGAPPDGAVDASGSSPLHRACSVGHLRAAEALLAGGADPNLRNSNGLTPLHAAAASSCAGAAELLLARGADPSLLATVGSRCGTPRMYASSEAARAPLRPAPAWGAVAQALVAAADGAAAARALLALLPAGRGLRPLQLYDLLWDETLEPDAAARVARRRLVVEQLIAPLVREAPARQLTLPEQALLIRACEATAGWHGGRAATASQPEQRQQAPEHRAAFDAAVRTATESFAAQLRAERAALAAQPGGAALLALPSTAAGAEGGLSQDADDVGGPAPWLDAGVDGDLAGAFRCALAPLGVVGSAEALCALLQGGLHRLLDKRYSRAEWAGARPCSILPRGEHFKHSVAPAVFWRHVCALQSVARHEPLSAEFHAHIVERLGAAAVAGGGAAPRFKGGPLKSYDRVLEKAAAYGSRLGLPDTAAGAGAAVARVVDVVRCSFVVPGASAALALCAWLDAATLAEHGLCALRRENGFSKKSRSSSSSSSSSSSDSGYCDVTYCTLYQSAAVVGAAGRAIVEVRVAVEAWLAVKEKMNAVDALRTYKYL